MRICKVWNGDYPWDVRVEKIASSLTDAGHEVHVVARNLARKEGLEILSEATVHRLRPLNGLPRKLDEASSFPAFVNPRWYNQIHEVATAVQADMLLSRDLPLAITSLWVARRLGIPCFVDLAEDYPAMVKERWHPKEFQLRNVLLRNPLFATLVENYVLERADHFWVVVEESQERLKGKGVPEERITLVGNTPQLDRYPLSRRLGTSRPLTGELAIVYLGGLGRLRGLDVAIRALARVRRGGVRASLRIVGKGGREAWYRQVAREIGVEDAVRFEGWRPLEEALGIVAECDIGLVPHHVTEFTQTTIPNKLFDYMALGLPVIVSDARPLARVVSECGCGLIFRHGDDEALAKCVRELADPNTRSAQGLRGAAAVRAKYRWEHDRIRLLESLETIPAERRQGRPGTSPLSHSSRAELCGTS